MERNEIPGTADDAFDTALPMLTPPQAAYLRELAAPHAEDGYRYALNGLAARCARAPQEQWPRLVAAHFEMLRRASRGDESAEELLRGAYARLLPVDSLTPDLADRMRYARVVAEGLVFAYALDGPDSVRILTDVDVERAGLQALGQAAYENLMDVQVAYEDVPVEGRATLHSVYGDSPFVASRALFLADTVRQLTGETLPEAGALVVVPTRHLLAYHPIADGTVIDALNDLAAYALRAYQDGPGPLSPRVYRWHQGGLTSLTVIDEETRTFSLQPDPHLLGLMKGLVRLDRAGRTTTGPASRNPSDAAGLERAASEALKPVARDPSGLGDAFAAALALALARCADDPKADRLTTWDAWATSVQLGCALFTGTEPVECYLGEDVVTRLPALPAAPPADARAWLDAFYLAVVCRQTERIDRLCEVPMERLREDDSVDEYVLHWIDTLQTYFARRSMDDVVDKLLATIRTSMPERIARAPKDFVNRIDYQPVGLFHRLITGDREAFADTLAEAVAEHAGYWGPSRAPRARVALGPLAMAALAHDHGFAVAADHPHLPVYLLDGGRIEHIP
ncbi:immunity 49 family protein [Streptomyces sp. BR123]|uniref:immunity 49 family protein n=1 Tax=Streptomyces sp. BR123 TaxID=2749828 RepID=UPI0015C470E0|nr:immunity 49 family protein [Streptomyces sp. BR123]NXY93781.1 immunity 49 family protein [Streptomyces sp. BR123]